MQARSASSSPLPFRGNRTFLYGGVAASILIVVTIALVALMQMRHQVEMRTALTTQNLAKLMEQTYDGLIDTVDVALMASADEISQEMSSGKINRQTITNLLVRQRKRLPHVAYLRATDERGDVIYGPDVLSLPNNNSDREYFIRLRDDLNAGLFINKPHISRINKKWDWLFARRIYKPDGSFGGVVYAAFLVDDIDKMLAKITLDIGDVATLRDGKLGVIARHVFQGKNPASPGDKKIAKPFADSLKVNPQEGTYVSGATSIDNINRMQSYRRSDKYGFYVNVGISSDAAMGVWRKQAWIVAGLVAAFALVTLSFSWLINRAWLRQEKDMEALHEAQEIASLGHYFYDLRTGRWTSSEILDGIFGIGSDFPRDARHWQELVAADTRHEIQKYLNTVVEQYLLIEREYRIVRPSDGQERWVLNKGKLNLDAQEKPLALVGTIQDITERKLAEEQIRYLAYFDSLTKLPNRRLLMDRLGQALIASNRAKEFGALMILDLDNFKVLNDTQGHDVGDQLLIEVAQRIVASARQEDTVSRLGGDEYVVMVENLGTDQISAAKQAEVIAEKIRSALNQPYAISLSDQAHHSTSSIGVALFCGQENPIDVLLKQADVALYQAKGAGRNTIRFFNPEMQATIDSRSEMEAAMRKGLLQDEFQLFYQPQIDLDGRLTGAEGLLRWFPANQAPISPAQFITIAEDTGLIIPIGLWVMQTACAQLKVWAETPRTRDLQIAINVSARQFRQPDFVKHVRESLDHSGANPALLKLELTESVVLDNVEEIIDRMQQIKALGVTFSLDDFGTGFSSLSYLKRLPLDQVKIDQSFVRDVTSDPNDAAIVRAIIAMSQSLGIRVIAEGVETEAQLDFLKSSGCTHYQGYLFGKPMPILEWGQFL